MRRVSIIFLLAAALTVTAEPPKPKERNFNGAIVAGSAPQAGAELAPGHSWTLDSDAVAVKDPIVADAKGQFQKSMEWKGEKTFLAMDKARKLGFALEIREGELAKPVIFRLVALVRVNLKVKSKVAGFPADGSNVEVRLEGAGRIGSATVRGEALSILVPPGSYKLRFGKEGWQPLEERFTVPAGRPEFAGPEVQLVPGLLTSRMGQEMPEWRIVDAIGIAKDTKMASFRGKWLLLEFWRHGCPSCRKWGIPNLVKFHDKHAGWKDRLQIIAFHNRDASNGSELTSLIAGAKDAEFKIPSLPFPVVIDSPGQSTVEEWGTGVFPYAVLLDKEGKLAAKGTLEDVEKFLEAQFK